MSEGWVDEPFGQSDRKDYEFNLIKPREELHSSKTRTAYKRMKLVPDNELASTTYKDSDILDFRLFNSGLIEIVNLDASITIYYKILGSLNPVDKWVEVVEETPVAPNTSVEEPLSDTWAFYKVQYSASSGTPKLKIIAAAKSLTRRDLLICRNLVMAPSVARTTSGNGIDFDVSRFLEGIFMLNVSAVSGTTPTLDVTIKSKDPVSLAWFTIATFTQKTAVSAEIKTLANCLGRKIRAEWVIGGTTPSFTFSIGAVLKG